MIAAIHPVVTVVLHYVGVISHAFGILQTMHAHWLRTTCLVLATLWSGAEVHAQVTDAQQATLREAVSRLADLDLEEWYYTRTTVTEAETVVDRHEPHRPGEDHWQLVSVDNEPPTEEDWSRYRERRSDHSESDDDRLTIGDLERVLVSESLTAEPQDDGSLAFSFHLRSPDGEKESMFERLRGTLRTVERESGTYPGDVRIWAVEPVYPMFGVRLTEFDLTMRFTPDEEQVFPSEMDFRVDGRAFLLKEIGEDINVRFSDPRRYDADRVTQMP